MVLLARQPAALFPAKPPPPELAPAPPAQVSVELVPVEPVSPPWAGAAVLDEGQARAVLAAAGWPAGRDLEEALRVSYGESVGWQVGIIGDGGRAHGLFQIHLQPWGAYCEMTSEQLLTAVANARCARLIFEYEQARGPGRWRNWTVKP